MREGFFLSSLFGMRYRLSGCQAICRLSGYIMIILWIIELLSVLITLTGKFFTKYDEELAKTFAVYCGISIYQVRVHTMEEV